MSAIATSVIPILPRIRPRTALVTSADRSFRQRLAETLTGLRWHVREAEGGAQAWAEAQSAPPEAVIVDSWLPDLDLGEFLSDFRGTFPDVDLLTTGGSVPQESPRGPYRQELLHALRQSQESDTPVSTKVFVQRTGATQEQPQQLQEHTGVLCTAVTAPAAAPASIAPPSSPATAAVATDRLPELIGNAPCMLEISRRVRLVAPRTTPVLIEGPTGSGKEVVAEALHRLSSRSRKPFIAINCAAIPEALLEAELFGHTRGAFTGAVSGRTGRIEAADGGTLFLDEIGEMPLALQSKLLRFVECGELQRVGENSTVKVDVRIIAATHRPLAQFAQNGTFRSDLYYRLAVFLIHTPSLAEHKQDLSLLVDHFLQKLGREMPMKRLEPGALDKLATHDWPGNVRELQHVLERAVILAGENPVLTAREIDFDLRVQ
jgi:DNA-binding NtrC family response regulator